MLIANAEKRRAATAEKAYAALDDLAWMRELIVQRVPSAVSARQLGTTLRRLLVNGELRDIAAPRVGRIEIRTNDTAGLLRVPRIHLYFSGRTDDPTQLGNYLQRYADDPIPSPSSEGRPLVFCRIDQFLAQKVICVRERWVNRLDVIKFVAINASSAHTKPATTDAELILAEARRLLWFDVTDTGDRKGTINPSGFGGTEFIRTEGTIDCVLLEAIAAAAYLCSSPDTIILEAEIRANG